MPPKRIQPNAFKVYEDSPESIKRLKRMIAIRNYKDNVFRVLPKPEDVFGKKPKVKKVTRSYTYLPVYQPVFEHTPEKSIFYRRKKKVIRSKKPPRGRRKYQKTGLQKLFEKLK